MRCFHCTDRLSAEREVMSNVCEPCGRRELARLYPPRTEADEAKRVRRCWQASPVESQTVQASGSLRYKAPSGSYFYVHPDLPGVAFHNRKAAARAARGL